MAEVVSATPPDSNDGGSASIGSNAVQLANKLSQVNYKNLKFIIMDRPTVYNLPSYLRELKKAVSYQTPFCFRGIFLIVWIPNQGVTAIVRVTEETYDAAEVEKAGISMHEVFLLIFTYLLCAPKILDDLLVFA